MEHYESIQALVSSAMRGDAESIERLYDVVYEDLRVIASELVRRSTASADATSLVHEGFQRLFRSTRRWKVEDRRYFFFMARRVMRDVLVERARKRALAPAMHSLDQVADAYLEEFAEKNTFEFERMHSILARFMKSKNERKRRRHGLIDLVYLSGIKIVDAAAMMKISVSQARADLRLAEAELRAELEGGQS